MGALDGRGVADPAAGQRLAAKYREYWRLILGILASLRIRHFDLLQPCRRL